MQFRAAGDAVHLRNEVLLRVEDHVIRSGLPGQLRLLLRRDGADDVRAAHLGHLREQQADASRGRVYETGVSRLQRER